jgi:1-phosphofructokinase family hexose kinase
MAATQELLSAGGKGLNVARGLRVLGVPCTVVGFVGGAVGDLLTSKAASEGTDVLAIRVVGETRIAAITVEAGSGYAQVVNPQGPEVDAGLWMALETEVVRRLRRSDPSFLVCTGSLPPGAPLDGYASLIEAARSLSVRTVVDAKGETLRHALSVAPTIVKVNRREAQSVVAQSDGRSDGVWLAEQLGIAGAGAAVVTDASSSVAGFDGEGGFERRVPQVEVRNAIGAGDAFLAGFVASLVAGASVRSSVARGIATGVASVSELQPGLFTSDSVARVESGSLGDDR